MDFTTLIDSTFEEYELHCIYVIPATDTAALWLRTSANAGSSWDSGASDYDTDSGAAGGAQVRLAASCENTVADGGFSGVIRIYNPADTTHNKRINWNYSNYNSSGTLITATSAARRVATTAITGLRVLFSSGNIAEGKFKLYGVKKS